MNKKTIGNRKLSDANNTYMPAIGKPSIFFNDGREALTLWKILSISNNNYSCEIDDKDDHTMEALQN